MQSKATYKLSASIISNIDYYKKFPTGENLDSIIDSLKDIFKPNEFFERGLKYEEEVFEGKHGKVSELVKDLPKQKWESKIVDCGDFNIRIAGKVDVIDTERKRIYDIKRTTNFNAGNYINSIQHIYYFYLFPEIEDFYYLVAYGKDKVEGHDIVHIKRPTTEELNKKVKESIIEFVRFLKDENLWEIYKENKIYRGSK